MQEFWALITEQAFDPNAGDDSLARQATVEDGDVNS